VLRPEHNKDVLLLVPAQRLRNADLPVPGLFAKGCGARRSRVMGVRWRLPSRGRLGKGRACVALAPDHRRHGHLPRGRARVGGQNNTAADVPEATIEYTCGVAAK